jgi:hypothetical protein
VLNGDEDGQPERVILFGATYAQLPGMDRQAIVGGAPFAARAERGHWQTESFHAGLTEERG